MNEMPKITKIEKISRLIIKSRSFMIYPKKIKYEKVKKELFPFDSNGDN